jgi:pimeloyl-ACP methyl ester carboxylesterase
MIKTRIATALAVAACAAFAFVDGAPVRASDAAAGAHANVLLVHGAFADGSSWDAVTRRLISDGYDVVSSQIPLTSFGDDVAAVRRDLHALHGPTVVVGNSYGGAVITQAAQDDPDVVGVVYIAAIAPDGGEHVGDFNALAPPLPSAQDFQAVDGGPFVAIARDRFAEDFCQDCSATQKRLLAASEAPINGASFGAAISGVPAWRQVPAWYQISGEDRIINPDAQRIMARRMDPDGTRTITLRSGHASLISHAQQVAAFVERAAR